MELVHPDSARALERENRELREELHKRAEQQSIMEQIVGNVSSLLDGSQDAMCIFDKDGHFLHINDACRRMLGLDVQHARLSLFEVYSARDRDRVIREFFNKTTTRWSGPITIHNKQTGLDNTIIQTIEALSSKLTSETPFFKSYFTPQPQDNTNDKIRMYNDMITHMPHGVGVWRLERGHTTPAVLRLACANKLATQYVGASLLPGSLIHEILPNGTGLEVHRFLEDVVRSQRVITLDSFRVGPHSFSVTAYPLYPDFVVVIMDPPKNPTTTAATPTPSSPTTTREKDAEWSSIVSSSGLAIAACEGTQVLHANEHLTAMLSVPQAYLKGRDLLTVLDTRVRSTSRAHLEQLRRAIRERVIHHVEVELEHFAWRISVHPMGEGSRQTLVVSHRTRTLAPQVHSQSQRPMFPILPSSLPAASPSSFSFNEPKSSSDTFLYKDTFDLIPCGIVIMKTEECSDSVRPQFRVVSLNQAAQSLPLSKGLTPGHRFDELTSPFEPAFLRAILGATKSQEGRVVIAGEGSKGEKQGARVVPLNDSAHVAIMFEDSSLFDKFDVSSSASPRGTAKRCIADLIDPVDRGYPVLPNQSHQHPTKYLRTPCKQGNEIILPFSSKSTHSILPPLQPPAQSPFTQPFSPSPPSLSSSRNDRLECIVQNCVVGITCMDPTGRTVMANKTFGQMLGYSESELNASLAVSDMLHPDDVAHARTVMRQVTTGETQSVDLPVRFIHKVSHSVVPVVASLMQIEKGVLMQIQQPNKLKNFPEVLLSDRDILRSTFREIVVGTAVLDVEEYPRIVSANGGFCAIMAATESELTGHALTDTLHPDDRDAVLTVAHDLVASRSQRSQLLSVRSHPRAGPARYGALSLSAVLDSKSSPFLLIAQLQLVDKPFS